MMRPNSTEQAAQEDEAAVATVQAYVRWLEEREAVRDAYERWTDGSSWGAALAFGAFEDALDREEHASLLYETVVRQFAADPAAAAPLAQPRALTRKDRSRDEHDAVADAA
jgi:hypothetical protein